MNKEDLSLVPSKQEPIIPEVVESSRIISIEVTQGGQKTEEHWKRASVHCPSCGAKSVWRENGNGDYNEGPEFLCSKCESSFSLPRCSKAVGEQQRERLAEIKKWE